MKKILLLSAALCLSLGLGAQQLTGRVVSVADGDTFTMIDTAYNEVKVRLYGVDCPEKKQDFGRHAQLKAAEYIAGKEVRVDVVNVDRYGRKVGIVYVCADSTLNEILLLTGLAWSYDEYNKLHRERYRELERQAKAAKVGLWSQPTWVAPWDYRGSKRKAQK